MLYFAASEQGIFGKLFFLISGSLNLKILIVWTFSYWLRGIEDVSGSIIIFQTSRLFQKNMLMWFSRTFCGMICQMMICVLLWWMQHVVRAYRELSLVGLLVFRLVLLRPR